MKRWLLYVMLLAGLALALSGCPSEGPPSGTKVPDMGSMPEDPLSMLESAFADLKTVLSANDMAQGKEGAMNCAQLATACQLKAQEATTKMPADKEPLLMEANGLAQELVDLFRTMRQVLEDGEVRAPREQYLPRAQEKLAELRSAFEELDLTAKKAAPAPTP